LVLLGHINGTSIVTKHFDMVKIQNIIKESMFHLKNLRTTSSSCNILRLSGWEDYEILFFRRPWNKTIFKKL